MRCTPSIVVAVVLGLAADARADTFYLHHSASPVTVPGGSTMFFLDTTVPPGATPVEEAIAVNRDATAAFPTFTSTAFGAPATLPDTTRAIVILSANQQMDFCADVSLTLAVLDAGGVRTDIATATAFGQTIAQTPTFLRVQFACGQPGPVAVPAGGAIAIDLAVTNNCSTNRGVTLSYDANPTPSRVDFTATPVGPVPFGPDDGGFLTLDKDESKCEQKIAGLVATLEKTINKCHQKQADYAFKLRFFDEEACEAVAIQKFLLKADPTQCPCVAPAGLATLWETVMDAGNGLVYCEGWDAMSGSCSPTTRIDPSGDDTGCIPSTKDVLRCQTKVSKCVDRLVRDWIKCHQKLAKDFQRTCGAPTFIEEECEEGPMGGRAAIERFNLCVAKSGVGTICPACNTATVPDILAVADAQLDGGNGLVFCESASGAFVEPGTLRE